MAEETGDALTPHQRIIRLFGKQTDLAKGLGLAARVVNGWYKSGLIPAKHQQSVYDLSVQLSLGIDRSDFLLPYPRREYEK